MSDYRELNPVGRLGASQSLRRLRDAGLREQKGRGASTSAGRAICAGGACTFEESRPKSGMVQQVVGQFLELRISVPRIEQIERELSDGGEGGPTRMTARAAKKVRARKATRRKA